MRRIGRYILNGLTVLSLVLCVASVGLWVRSYFEHDVWAIEAGSIARRGRDRGEPLIVELGAQSVRGQLILSQELSEYGLPLGRTFHNAWAATRPATGMGFHARFNEDSRWIEIPLWFASLLTSILPIWRIDRRRRYRLCALRRHAMQCVKCGYDLRATPDRCPECGTIPTKVKA